MRSNKITKNAENVLKIQFKGLISHVYKLVFRHGDSESEVHFDTGSRINVVSARVQ